MKKLILPLFFLLFISTESKVNQWMTSFEEAKKMAITTNKFIIVDFWATWCGPCLKMDFESWNEPEVKEILNNFIPLKIDIDDNRTMASSYSIKAIPYVFILDPNGEIVYKKMSYMNKNEVIKLLKKYSLTTKKIQTQYTNYYKNKSGDNALKIAEKYIDFSIYVDKSIKKDFLKLANVYLKKTSKLYKKEGNKNKHSQRINLLREVYSKIVKGDYEKSLKILEKKFKETAVEDSNRELYDFLNFAVYNKLEDKDNAKKWYEKLKTHKNHKALFMKSRRI